MERPIFTIGHSNHTWEAFAALLRQHGIQVLVDTRSNPQSRWAPFASAGTLPSLLEGEGIRYVFMGNSLGGKPADPSAYDANGKPDYRKMRATDEFQRGIGELLDLAEGAALALMCAEEDPGKCHRRLLIGPALEQRGVALIHIREDGSVQSSDAVGNRKAYNRQLQGALPFTEDGP